VIPECNGEIDCSRCATFLRVSSNMRLKISGLENLQAMFLSNLTIKTYAGMFVGDIRDRLFSDCFNWDVFVDRAGELKRTILRSI
jgi:hypothetical protein